MPVLGALVALLGLTRAGLSLAKSQGPDEVVLLYLVVAAALLLLRNVDELAFKEFKFKMRDMNAVLAGVVASSTPARDQPDWTPPQLLPVTNQADSNRGRFGGSATANGRAISATVSTGVPADFFLVKIEVRSLVPGEKLVGTAQFFLHETFERRQPVVPVDSDGVFRYVLNAWGAFTVGVVLDRGTTMLELDLATIPGVSPVFANR